MRCAIRAAIPRDYDQWRQLGLDGWGYADVLPYFRRSENSWRGANKYHGAGGPLRVRLGVAPQLFYEPLQAAAVAAGYPESDGHSRRCPRRHRAGGADDRRLRPPPFDRARLSQAGAQRRNLTLVTRRADHARAHRERPRGRRRLSCATAARQRARATREVILCRRRLQFAAAPDAVRHRPGGRVARHGITSLVD